VAHRLGHGILGAAVAAWPTVALVGSFELLMMIIRAARVTADAIGIPGYLDVWVMPIHRKSGLRRRSR
jgi:hypothetical protein